MGVSDSQSGAEVGGGGKVPTQGHFCHLAVVICSSDVATPQPDRKAPRVVLLPAERRPF